MMNLSRIIRWSLSLALMLTMLFPTARIQHAQRSQSSPAAIYDVRSFGAKGDGKTLDTSAINRAIGAAAAAGGGTVDFPAGTYLSVSIHLQSNITLQLDQNATILARRLAEILDNPELARQMGISGQRKVQQQFSWAGIADAHLALYSRLAESSRP